MENRKQYDINLHTFIHCNLDLHTGEKKNGIYITRFLRKIIDDQLVGSIQFQFRNLS